MKHRTMLQMSILVALGLGVLFSLVAFDQPGRQDTELLEVSVIIREADSTPTARRSSAACLPGRWRAAPMRWCWFPRTPRTWRTP